MKTWSVYRLTDGLFTGQTFTIPEDDLSINTPNGCAHVEGFHDHLSKRIDLETGTVLDYQPPQPSLDHEWVHDDEKGNRIRRWRLTAKVQAQKNADAQARGEIARLEASQHRAIREVALKQEGAEARLQSIDDQIAELRKKLLR